MSYDWLQKSREKREREYADHMAPAWDWGHHISTWLVLTCTIISVAVCTIGMFGMFKPYDDAITFALFPTLVVMSQVTWLTGTHAKGTDTAWDYFKRALKYQLVTFALVFGVSFVVLYFFIL